MFSQNVLNVNVTDKMIAISKHWYAWQLVYNHDVIESNEKFTFLGIGEKLPPVLLPIEVALLNKYLSQNTKINNLLIKLKHFRQISLQLCSQENNSVENGEKC